MSVRPAIQPFGGIRITYPTMESLRRRVLPMGPRDEDKMARGQGLTLNPLMVRLARLAEALCVRLMEDRSSSSLPVSKQSRLGDHCLQGDVHARIRRINVTPRSRLWNYEESRRVAIVRFRGNRFFLRLVACTGPRIQETQSSERRIVFLHGVHSDHGCFQIEI